MNFLAHIYLSGDDSDIRVGNFIGDFVKGAQMESFPTSIKNGILLHRQIDSFTDAHPVVRKSKERLHAKYRHYAGVIVDVFYDHFLAKNWDQYSSENLLEYTDSFYKEIAGYKEIIPDKANHMLIYMKRDNWLFNYRLVEGIDRSLTGMSRRTTFVSHMENASQDLENHMEEFSDEFSEFFPDLQAHCREVISQQA